MKKKMNLLLVALMILMLAVIGTAVIKANAKEPTIDHSDYYYYSYEIKWGDTLWTIAEANLVEGDDIREWIKEVKKINGMNSDFIRSNDHIIILAKR